MTIMVSKMDGEINVRCGYLGRKGLAEFLVIMPLQLDSVGFIIKIPLIQFKNLLFRNLENVVWRHP
jgi:hypothetical protein